MARLSAGIEGWGHVAHVLDGRTRGGSEPFWKSNGSTTYTKPFARVFRRHDGRMPDPLGQQSKIISEFAIAQGSVPESDDARLAADPLGFLVEQIGFTQEVISKA